MTSGDVATNEILEPAWRKIKTVGLPTEGEVEAHLGDAERAWNAGRWKDAASNYRHVIEAVLDGCAIAWEKCDPKKRKIPVKNDAPGRAGAVREYLEKIGFLTKNERESIGGIYGMASNFGNHYGIIESGEARVIRGLVITMTAWVGERWEPWLKKQRV